MLSPFLNSSLSCSLMLLLLIVLLLARLSVLLLLLLVHLLLLLLVLLLLRVLLLLLRAGWLRVLLLRAGWLRVLMAATVAALPPHLLIVSLMLRQNLLTHLLFALVDVWIQLVAVLLDRKFLIIVNRNEDLLRAHWLLLRIVELRHIRMLQGLLCCQSLIRVKLKQILEKVECLFRSRREHVPQLLWLRWR